MAFGHERRSCLHLIHSLGPTTAIALASLAGLVQAAVVCRATVPALDAVWFARLARQIDLHGVGTVAAGSREQPLFPVWVWLVHKAVEAVAGSLEASWAMSVQLAAAFPTALAVVPVYFISIRLVGKGAAAVGAVIFSVLPGICRLGADGISDSTHLLWFGLAAWAVVEYLARVDSPPTKRRRLACFALMFLGGFASATAYLVRLEAMVLPAALVVTLGTLVFREPPRLPWWRLMADLGCFALGLGIVCGLSRILSGTGDDGRDSVVCAQPPASEAGVTAPWSLADGSPMAFDSKEPTVSIRRRGYGPAAVQFLEELGDLFGVWVGLPALFGIWRLRRRPPSAVDRFFHALLVLFTIAVLHHTATEGYLSARHLAMWAIPGVACAGYGVLELGRLLTDLVGKFRAEHFGAYGVSAAVLAAIVAACGLQLAKPLHGSHLGHRLAAKWLANPSASAGAVFDTHGWTGLYSGRFTYPPDQLQRALCDPKLNYLVVEREELNFESPRSRTLQWLIATAAEPAATFPDQPGRVQAVTIYRWNADRFRAHASSPAAGHGDRHTSSPAAGSSRAAWRAEPRERRR